MPSSCAVLTTSTQAAAGSLPLVSTQRTSSSRISAAVPGMVSRPGLAQLGQPVADRHAGLGGGGDDLHRARTRARACSGTRALIARTRSAYAGDRQLRVDAALHAHLGGAGRPRLLGPVGDLLDGQPVRVGVPLPLGEGAEPAAHVADVGEVDVAVDHVGDVVADRVPAQVVGEPAQLVQRRPVRAEQRQRRRPRAAASSSAAGSSAASRSPAAVTVRVQPPAPRSRRRAVDSACLAGDLGPVAVDACRSRRAGRRCGRWCRWWRAGRSGRCRRPPSGSCHGRPGRQRRLDGQPGRRVGQRRDVRRQPRVEPRRRPRRTYSG